MPEPFKNLFNLEKIRGMSMHFHRHWPQFDAAGFVRAASDNLDALELKARSAQITDAMIEFLPSDFAKAGEIMLASLKISTDDNVFAESVDDDGIAGWAVMPMTHYVGLRGLDHFDLSMNLLKQMTKCSSSEFGIRFFLIDSPGGTLSVLKSWTSDSNQHVRRLVSEGTRPRLPWAMQLPEFIKAPAAVIELLECLKDDDKEYVRRSVANNLNDIAKDHPDLVADIAEKWMRAASLDRTKLIRHACRSLIKNGHKKTLQILGYGPPKITSNSIEMLTPEVKFGNSMQFKFTFSSDSREDQALMIDYIIHHRKANGSTSAKVFKWKNFNLMPGKTIASIRKHAFKKITTRVYYPGVHRVEVVVNGVSMGTSEFKLTCVN
jgi:3-methyladenine DNA glycosylase AlkC